MARHFSGIFMIGFLAVALGIAGQAAWHNRHALETQDWSSIIQGKTTRAYEKKFDEALVLNDVSTRGWGTFNQTLFREGKKGVVIDADDTYFTSEEYAYYPDAQENAAQKMKYIEEIHNKFKARGARLVVLPIPAKARILAGDYPSYNKPVYDYFLKSLRNLHIAAPNVLTAFEGKDVFLKYDTHWTPDGAKIAAQTLDGFYDGGKVFETAAKDPVQHEGDLARYAPLFENKTEEIREAETSSQGDDLFGDEEIPVVLVGTSYSANPSWNFEGALKEALNADVLNMADEGLGPFETMKKYLNSDIYKTKRPDIIVWEIPERYLVMPYNVSAP